MATDVERLVVSLEANIKKYEREMERSRAVTENALRSVERSVSASASKIDSRMASVGASIRGGIATALAGISVGKLTELSDSFTKIQNQLKVGGLEGKKLSTTYQALFDIAQKQGAPLEELATLYGRASSAQKELNASTSELLQFTNATALALRVGGTSAQEASGALLQLSQALGGGKIQAEEYNSLIDGLRPLLQAAAAGIKEAGGSVAKLTGLVKEGKISSEAFFRGVLAGTPAIEALAQSTQETSSQALARLNNALIDLVGKLRETTGVTDNSVLSINNFAEAIEGIGKGIPAAIELLAKLAKQAQETATTFGNLPVFKRLAEKYADKGEFKPLLNQGLEKYTSPETAKAIDKALNGSLPKFGSPKPGEIEGIDKLREAFKARGIGVPKEAKPDPNNMFDRADEINRKALTPDPISYKKYKVPGEKEKAGGGSGAEKVSAYDREVQAIEKRTRAFDSERQTVGKTALEVAKAEASFKLLEAAEKAGTPVTDTLRSKIDTLASAYARAKVALDEAEEKQRAFEATSRQFGATLSDGFKDAILNGEKLGVVINQLVKSLASRGIDSVFDSLFAKGGAGANLLSSAGGGLGGLISGITGRAGGGPVKAGTAYTVGESGRETFVPTQPGRIIPAGRTGRSSSIRMGDINISAPGADRQGLMELRTYVDAARREDRRLIGQSLANWKENN